MTVYRLKKGYGAHVCLDGHEINQNNPVYETDEDLVAKIPDKFERVYGNAETVGHAYGDIITGDFPLASTISQCVVWKKGRRYRVTVNGRVVDTDRLINEDDVNACLKKLSKSVEKDEVEDEDGEPLDEDTDDDATDTEDEEEDEEKPVKPVKRPKKSRR